MGSKQKTETVTEPWEPVQPYLEGAASDLYDAYQGGAFSIDPYTGQRIAGQGDLTTGAYDYLRNLGAAGDPFLSMGAATLPGVLGQTQMADLTMQGVGGVGDIALSGNNPYGAGALASFYDAVTGPNQPLGGLDTSREMLNRFGGGDLYAQLDDVKQNVLADVVPAVSSRFANAGMLDSSLAADTISRSAAEAIAPIEYGAWENAQNRGMNAYSQAAGMEQGAYENARARQMQALGAAPGLMSSRYIDPFNAIAAGGVLDQFNMQDQSRISDALRHVVPFSGTQFNLPNAMLQAGAGQDAYSQANINAAMKEYYERQGQDMSEFGALSSMLLPYGGLGGTTTQTASSGGGLMGFLGPALQIGGMAAGLGAFGGGGGGGLLAGAHSTMNPYTSFYNWSPG